eukprot:1830300-Amphidinium_carterae.1
MRACEACARLHGHVIRPQDVYYDKGVSGATPVFDRPAFVSMLAALTTPRTSHIYVEDASRLARDLM